MSAPGRCPFAHGAGVAPRGATVAVTGASGLVGCNLLRTLVDAGFPVRAVVPGPASCLAGLPVEVAYADVRHPETLRAAFRGVDTVFHLAGRISIDDDRDGQVRAVNVWGARNAARAALAMGVRRFVHMSSVHAFDLARRDGSIDEDAPRAGAGHAAYDRSKAEGEEAVRAVIAEGLDAVIVNPVGILGPWDHAPSRIGRSLLDMARGRVPVVPAGGFHFVDARDVARSTLAAAAHGRRGANYILPGTWVSAVDFARLVKRCAGGRVPVALPPRVFDPVARVATLGARVLGREPLLTREMVQTLQANPRISGARAAAELGHAPRPLEESFRDAFAWFRAQGILAGAVAA